MIEKYNVLDSLAVEANDDEKGIVWEKNTRSKRRRLLVVSRENDNEQITDDHGDTI